MPEIHNQQPTAYNVSCDMIGTLSGAGGVIPLINKESENHARMVDSHHIDLHAESRWDKFSKTFLGSIESGAEIGSLTGNVVMFAPDLVTGKGTDMHAKYDPEQEGLAGLVAHAAVDGVSTVAMLPGAIVGGTVGLMTEPFTPAPCGKTTEKIANDGAEATSTLTSAALSLPVGLALGAARLPSMIVKGATTLAGGIVGGVLGFFGGLSRAIFNV